MTQDHSHMFHFFFNVIHLINKYFFLDLYIIWKLKKLNIEQIAFKVVQMKFLAMHITNPKFSFDIFMVGTLQNIFV